LSRRPGGTCTWGSHSGRGNRPAPERRTSAGGFGPLTEVAMTHWARWSAALTVASLVAAGLAAQGSGGAGDPLPASPSAGTTAMLLHAAATGDWPPHGGNYWNDRYLPRRTSTTAN